MARYATDGRTTGWSPLAPTRPGGWPAAVALLCVPGDVLLLAGDLGAGKTTFAQGFGAALGITEPITSPTFTLVRQYPVRRGSGLRVLLHADVYRLDHLHEVVDLGLGELVEDGGVALVEWGDAAAPVLGAGALTVRLDGRTGRGTTDRAGDHHRAAAVAALAGPWAALAEPLAPLAGGPVTLLAIESATDMVGVGLVPRTGRRPSGIHAGGRAHAELLAPAIEEVCAVSGLHRREVDADRRRHRARAVHRAAGGGGHGQGPGPGAGHRRGGGEQPRRPGRRRPLQTAGAGAGPRPGGVGGRRPPGRGVRRGLPFDRAAPGEEPVDPASVRDDRPSRSPRRRWWPGWTTSSTEVGLVRVVGDGAPATVRCWPDTPGWTWPGPSELSAPPPLALARLALRRLAAVSLRWPPPSWYPTTGDRPTPGSTGSSGLPGRHPPVPPRRR